MPNPPFAKAVDPRSRLAAFAAGLRPVAKFFAVGSKLRPAPEVAASMLPEVVAVFTASIGAVVCAKSETGVGTGALNAPVKPSPNVPPPILDWAPLKTPAETPAIAADFKASPMFPPCIKVPTPDPRAVAYAAPTPVIPIAGSM